MSILVITKVKDIHTSYVVEKLEEGGERVFVLRYSEFPRRAGISFSSENNRHRLVFEFRNGEIVDSTDIKSVYNRRQEVPRAPSGLKNRKIKDYIVRESQYFLDSLSKTLNAFWVSDQDAIIKASCKPYQLMEAQKIGFEIPATLISNSPSQIADFVNSCRVKDFAVKSLYTPGIILGRGNKRTALSFYTQRVNGSRASELAVNAANCPTVFQQYIEKKFELRITVVGEKVFPCAIHSQKSERTRDDWRRYDLPNTPHEVFKLPVAIEEKCVLLVKNLGLVFGCIDMIVAPKSRYVFLEINPNGQWLWIEKLTGLPIGNAIIDMLKGGKI